MNADFKINGRVIETERLILRAFTQNDLDDFYEYASVDGVGERAGWKHHSNKDESKKILNLFIEEDKTFAICYKENNKVIGSLGVEKYHDENLWTEFSHLYGRELGYVLSKDYWGKGIMPEAVNAAIDYLFIDLNMDFLTCGYFEPNVQSKRVQEKCGFKYHHIKENVSCAIEGVSQTVYFNCLSKKEWLLNENIKCNELNENIKYSGLNENNIDEVVDKYINYYNMSENGRWTVDKAYKRIHQVMITEDSYCIIQSVKGNISGFIMGYYKQFDDIIAYFLEEIVIFDGFRRLGLGTLMMKELEKHVINYGAEHIELLSVNDDLHDSFYGKLGYWDAKNLSLKGKHLKK